MQLNKNFFQIYLTTDGTEESNLSVSIEEASLASRQCFDGFEYFRWGTESLREFFHTSLEPEVLNAFDALKPLAYKVDLAQLCVLYVHGGWYADITSKIVSPDISKYSRENVLLFFKDHGMSCPSAAGTSFDCAVAFLYASAKHPALLACIKQIILNVKNRYYGFTAMSPTGPRLFGRILAGFDLGLVRQLGWLMPLTPSLRKTNLAYVAENGEILAWHKTAWHPSGGADLGAMGLTKTNSYRQLWRDRDVYY